MKKLILFCVVVLGIAALTQVNGRAKTSKKEEEKAKHLQDTKSSPELAEADRDHMLGEMLNVHPVEEPARFAASQEISQTKPDQEMFEVLTDSQQLEFLNQRNVKTADIKDYKKKLKPLGAKDADAIQIFVGRYKGKMSTHGGYFSVDPAVFDAEVEFSGEKIGQGFVGDIEVRLIDDKGKTISHSQYHGQITSFYTDEAQENPNLFSEDGDAHPSFYQFFLSRSLQQMIGSYYAPPVEGQTEFRRIGTLRLNRL